MLIFVVVDIVDHRCQRRRLTGSGGASNQHQAAGHHGYIAENLTHTQIFHCKNLTRNRTKYACSPAILIKCVNSKTGKPRHLEGEISFKELFVVLALFVIHDVVDQFMDLLVLHGGEVDATNITIDTNHRRETSRQVQIGCALLCSKGQ